jgi:hypothetical protein
MRDGTREVVGKKIVLRGVCVQDKVTREQRKFLTLHLAVHTSCITNKCNKNFDR